MSQYPVRDVQRRLPFAGQTFYIHHKREARGVGELKADIKRYGGSLCPHPGDRFVTHILIMFGKDYRDLIYDLDPSSPRHHSGEWTERELVSEFGRREHQAIRPGDKIVLQAAWVRDCIATGRYLDDRSFNGWEIRGRMKTRPDGNMNHRDRSSSPTRLSLASRIGNRRSPEHRPFISTMDRYRPGDDRPGLGTAAPQTAPRASLNDRISSAPVRAPPTPASNGATAPSSQGPIIEKVHTPPSPTQRTTSPAEVPLSVAPKAAGLPPRPTAQTLPTSPESRSVRTSTSRNPAPTTPQTSIRSSATNSSARPLATSEENIVPSTGNAIITHLPHQLALEVSEDMDIKPLIIVDDPVSAPPLRVDPPFTAPVAAVPAVDTTNTAILPEGTPASIPEDLRKGRSTLVAATQTIAGKAAHLEASSSYSQSQSQDLQPRPAGTTSPSYPLPPTQTHPAHSTPLLPLSQQVSKGKKRTIEDTLEPISGPSRRPEVPRRDPVTASQGSLSDNRVLHTRAVHGSQPPTFQATISPAPAAIIQYPVSPALSSPFSTFLNPSGLPMSFYVTRNAMTLHVMVEENIILHGGTLADSDHADVIVIFLPAGPTTNDALLGTLEPDDSRSCTGKLLVSPSYITDCKNQGRMLSIHPYRIELVVPSVSEPLALTIRTPESLDRAYSHRNQPGPSRRRRSQATPVEDGESPEEEEEAVPSEDGDSPFEGDDEDLDLEPVSRNLRSRAEGGFRKKGKKRELSAIKAAELDDYQWFLEEVPRAKDKSSRTAVFAHMERRVSNIW